nr:hypothetical protein [Lachnospiraceae bacterium]
MNHGGDIYRNKVKMDFSVNLNPMGTPEGVLAAVERSIASCGAYPDIEQESVRALLGKYTGCRPEQIIAGNGASELIMAGIRAFSPK